MAGEGEVREGFLCPLCMKDLGDVVQLQVHFEESHSREDPAIVRSLKDLFGKAKSAIQSNDDVVVPQQKLRVAPERTDIDPVSGVRKLEFPSSTNDAPGRSHFQEFKKIRGARVDRYATETNRLVVRLDKLLRDMPAEPAKRREHERGVVAWIDEDLVKLCPSCARSFNPVRRKHHCRLCGSVMCQDCSQWVDWDLCRRLTNPASLSSYKAQPDRTMANGRDHRDTRSVGTPTSTKSLFRLRRTNSRESLASSSSSVGGRSGGEEFRACSYCKQLLEYRERLQELQSHRPIVAQFYSSLAQHMVAGEELSPKYLNMHASLMHGENTYNLDDAKLLRVRLLKLAENIDLMSKRIESLGRDSIAPESAPRKFKLQEQIRRAAVNFIKETLVGLPSLPSAEEVVKLQEQRQAEMQRQAEEERERAAEAKLKFQRMQEKRKSEAFRLPSPGFPTAPAFVRTGSFRNKVSHESGFVVSSSSQEANSVNEDPMVQQMNNLRGYIQQAREANMFDEVSMLESNLRMLQEEFKRQKEEEAVTAANQRVNDLSLEEASNPFSEEPSNPFSQESSNPFSQESSNPFSEEQTASSYVSFPSRTSKPPVFDEVSKELVVDETNPFGEEEEDDEYDSSGKNPFAE